VWFAAAAIFSAVNLFGVVYAGLAREGPHAAIHVALLIPGLWAMWLVGPAARRRAAGREPAVDERIEYLQQSVDALALEVERLGEAQRARERSRVEQIPPLPPKKDQP
jgi:hypothetical protein